MKTIRYKNKLYLLDIGLWILLLMKLSKIIIGIKIMTIKKVKLPQFIIGLCIGIVVMWQLYDFANFDTFSVLARLGDATSTVLVGGLGALLIAILTFYKPEKNTVIWINSYGLIVFFYGVINAAWALVGVPTYGQNIAIAGVVLSLLAMGLGTLLAFCGFDLNN